MKLIFDRAGAIIFDKTYKHVVVVLNRLSYSSHENKWGLPKGHRRRGETVFECARREVSEEVGISMYIDKQTPSVILADTIYFVIIMDGSTHFVTRDPEEIADIRWMSRSDLEHKCVNRALRELVVSWNAISRKSVSASERKFRLNAYYAPSLSLPNRKEGVHASLFTPKYMEAMPGNAAIADQNDTANQSTHNESESKMSLNGRIRNCV